MFSMSEKLCLQWNDFKENIISSVGNLREDQEFTDMTLACENGRQIEAHKIILAGSSPFFDNVLKRNKHSHPLVYMKGMKSEDMAAIVDFLYRGEANVFQENLDSFLAIAEELKLKGLTGEKAAEVAENDEVSRPVNRLFDSIIKKETFSSKQSSSFITHGQSSGNVGDAIATISHFSGNLKELDEKTNSMMEKTSEREKASGKPNGLPLYVCKVCGKKATSGNIKKHIEANHLEGVLVPCSKCEKTFRSRNALAVHTYSIHRGYIQ